MQKQIMLLAIVCASLPSSAQSGNISDWPNLIKKCDVKAAKPLCESYVNSKDITQQAEAQKCLANFALCGHDVVHLESDEAGGGNIHGGYTSEAVDEALTHLNLGLKFAPLDVSIHEGRLHLLEVSGRYSDLVEALDDSCTIYKGKDAPEAWLAYSAELSDLRQYNLGLAFMKVLNTHYPNNPDVLGNIGAFLSYLKRDDEAVPYLQKAAEMAPKDPINAWDLGREYDYTGQTALADKWYQKGLSLMTDADQKKESECLYGQFIEKKLDNLKRACSMEHKSCASDGQTACAPPAPEKAP
jgi:tetratricopeptide (TPR) repeat protein